MGAALEKANCAEAEELVVPIDLLGTRRSIRLKEVLELNRDYRETVQQRRWCWSYLGGAANPPQDPYFPRPC